MEFYSTMPLASTAVSLAVLILVIFFARQKNKKYPPIAGTVLHQLINFHRVHHYMTELACKYKTYRMLGLFKTVVYTADPANVEYVFKTNFANYGKVYILHINQRGQTWKSFFYRKLRKCIPNSTTIDKKRPFYCRDHTCMTFYLIL